MTVLLWLIALCLTSTVALADDAETLAALHRIATMEIAEGRLVDVRTHSADVRRYGDLLQNDFGMLDKRVKDLARTEGVGLTEIVSPGGKASGEISPQEKRILSAESERRRNLESLNGPEFDKEFVAEMGIAQEKILHNLQGQEIEVTTTMTRRFIDHLIPLVRQHQELLVWLGKGLVEKGGRRGS